MTLSPKMLGLVAAISAGAIAGAIGAATSSSSSKTLETTLSEIRADVADTKKAVAAMTTDVALLKCAADVPGACPGQARRR